MAKEFKLKEETLVRVIMENGGSELEQFLLTSNNLSGGEHILKEYMK